MQRALPGADQEYPAVEMLGHDLGEFVHLPAAVGLIGNILLDLIEGQQCARELPIGADQDITHDGHHFVVGNVIGSVELLFDERADLFG